MENVRVCFCDFGSLRIEQQFDSNIDSVLYI